MMHPTIAIVNRRSLAAAAMDVAKGTDSVRVHDVKEMARVCKMSDAIIRGWP